MAAGVSLRWFRVACVCRCVGRLAFFDCVGGSRCWGVVCLGGVGCWFGVLAAGGCRCGCERLVAFFVVLRCVFGCAVRVRGLHLSCFALFFRWSSLASRCPGIPTLSWW